MGERIRLLRQLRGITQADLGTQLGVSFQQIQKYERGANRLSIGMFIAGCKALRVHPMDLIGSYFSDGDEVDATETLMTKLREAQDRLRRVKQALE